MTFGERPITATTEHADRPTGVPYLELRGLSALNDRGAPAVRDISLSVASGEIVGVAGVSGNGQRELVEVLAAQREAESGEITVAGCRYRRTRSEMRALRVCLLAEEPLASSCVRAFSVADNLALRDFDVAPFSRAGGLIDRNAIEQRARTLIDRFRIRCAGPRARVDTLSGGNVQRTVLARELTGDVRLLIAQNPCLGLDFAATGEIRSRILDARNRGAAVLLLSEDLDELLELSDRIVVMLEGRLVFAVGRQGASAAEIGRHMTGHQSAPDMP
jgi:simple sugar transport system ATP-binding protein